MSRRARSAWGGPLAALGLVALLVAVALLLSGGGCRLGDRVRREVAREIRARLDDPGARRRWFARSPERALVGDRAVEPLVRRFYERRGCDPAWSTGAGPREEAAQLAAALLRSWDDGLDPADVQAAQARRHLADCAAALAQPEARRRDASAPALAAELADLDLLLTRSFFKLAAHLQAGVFDPARLPSDWHIRPRHADLVHLLERALAAHEVGGAFDRLEPPHRGYGALRGLLARYRAIRRAGGWPAIGPGPTLRLRSAGARVQRLRARLAASGDLDGATARGERYDAALAAAVRDFQARHGLPATGTVGEREVAELDVPVESRIRQIELNLERWRWLPASLGQRHVLVNIPAFALEVRDHDTLALAMRVVVGRLVSRTPMFSDSITHLAFNPVWDVPPDIGRNEVLPAQQKDPGYLARNHLRLYRGHGKAMHEVDPAKVKWAAVTPEHFGFAVKQDPGPDNSIGRVKFVCPNPYQIYLHDTPAGHLFGATQRDFSHGCVRVEHPLELAIELLRGKAGWDSARTAAAVDSERITVRLPQPVPVHLLYWTTWVDDAGRAQFRRDVYAVDSLQAQAQGRARNQPASPVEWGRIWPPDSAAAESAARAAAAESAARARGKGGAPKRAAPGSPLRAAPDVVGARARR
jgi:L,D-transpeptidase YcbB